MKAIADTGAASPRLGKAAGLSQTPNGFTLLEMMVAVTIIAIVLLAVYRLHSQTLLMNQSAQFYSVAPLLAQKKLAELATGDGIELLEQTGDFGDDYPGYGWKVDTEPVAVEDLEDTEDRFRRIDLTLTFNGDELRYQVRTYRLEQPEDDGR